LIQSLENLQKEKETQSGELKIVRCKLTKLSDENQDLRTRINTQMSVSNEKFKAEKNEMERRIKVWID
jgi:hypothetical protein